MIVKTAFSTFGYAIAVACGAFFATFVFLAYFQPETLNELTPLASQHIREAVQLISNFIQTAINKIV